MIFYQTILIASILIFGNVPCSYGDSEASEKKEATNESRPPKHEKNEKEEINKAIEEEKKGRNILRAPFPPSKEVYLNGKPQKEWPKK